MAYLINSVYINVAEPGLYTVYAKAVGIPPSGPSGISTVDSAENEGILVKRLIKKTQLQQTEIHRLDDTILRMTAQAEEIKEQLGPRGRLEMRICA